MTLSNRGLDSDAKQARVKPDVRPRSMATEQTATEVRKLVGAIQALGAVKPSIDRAWTRASAVKVIDCVLSLNRRYDSFVVPRLDHFEAAHPRVVHVADLRRLIDSYPSPIKFLAGALAYHDARRAQVLSRVVDRLMQAAANSTSRSEPEALASWAQQARPSDYREWAIRGFGLGGFQYLRMLFGANTMKPDVHICRWVSDCISRRVGPEEALDLLELAARQSGTRLRDVDTTVWECSARPRSRRAARKGTLTRATAYAARRRG